MTRREFSTAIEVGKTAIPATHLLFDAKPTVQK
jgi:hypothetical protein